MKKYSPLLLVILLLWMTVPAQARIVKLASPDQRMVVTVRIDSCISYSVTSGGVCIIRPSRISMTVNGGERLGIRPRLVKSRTASVRSTIRPPFYKKKVIEDCYNELVLQFHGDYSLEFRAYDDGMAYRFATGKEGDMTVVSEQSEYLFDGDHPCWIQYANRWGKGDKYYTTFENSYVNIPLSQVAPPDSLIVTPMVVDLGCKKVALLEADLEDYAGMFLKRGATPFSLAGDYANLPARTSISGDEMVAPDNLEAVVDEGFRLNYIAHTRGTRTFPWRAMVIADRDIDFANNDMVYRLAAPSRIADMSWIKPGKVAWDWWIECDLWNVDFVSGVNYDTYCEYINFAAEKGLEYIMIDVGFSQVNDIMAVNPDIQLEKLVKYANSKGVGILVWCGWLAIKNQMEAACKHFSALGIKGFKIDYMNRDDQEVVNFYYDMARMAARYKLTVDFHGAYKPTGLQRTYPNVLTVESVKGQEWCRWTNPDQPRHAVTIPFIRSLAGPMDFTPGVFRSESREVFKPSWIGSMGQGTRAHQMAMYTVFESPLQMLSDSPSRYRQCGECTDFIAKVPTVWDETRVLDGRIGEFIVTARRTADTWFVGALTNWQERDVVIDFSFLSPGTYRVEYFRDGVNANKTAADYRRVVTTLSAGECLPVHLASGGGWTARITPVK